MDDDCHRRRLGHFIPVTRLVGEAVSAEEIFARQVAERTAAGITNTPYYYGKNPWANDTIAKPLYGNWVCKKLKYDHVVSDLIHWLLKLYPPASGVDDFALDVAETVLAMTPAKEPWKHIRTNSPIQNWFNFATSRTWARSDVMLDDDDPDIAPGAEWTEPQFARLWRMLRWLDEPVKPDGKPLFTRDDIDKANKAARRGNSYYYHDEYALRDRVGVKYLLLAHDRGLATDDDLYDLLLGPREERWGAFAAFAALTGRKRQKRCGAFPKAFALAGRARDRVLEIELQRGDAHSARRADVPRTGPRRPPRPTVPALRRRRSEDR